MIVTLKDKLASEIRALLPHLPWLEFDTFIENAVTNYILTIRQGLRLNTPLATESIATIINEPTPTKNNAFVVQTASNGDIIPDENGEPPSRIQKRAKIPRNDALFSHASIETKKPPNSLSQRETIRDYIKANPETNMKEIAEGLDIHYQTVYKHVSSLIKSGWVQAEKRGHSKHLTWRDRHGNSQIKPTEWNPSQEVKNRILRYLLENGPTRKKDIVGIPPKTFFHASRALHGDGLIKARYDFTDARSLEWFIPKDKEEEVKRLVNA